MTKTDETPTLALACRQPWCELILLGKKVREFRTVLCNVRERVYVYASMSRYSRDEEAALSAEHGLDLDKLVRGVLVGTVEVTGCERQEDGSFAWLLARPERLATPLKPRNRAQPCWFRPF